MSAVESTTPPERPASGGPRTAAASTPAAAPAAAGTVRRGGPERLAEELPCRTALLQVRRALLRRDQEMATVRALARRLHPLHDETAILHAALEVILEALRLPAGWILLTDAPGDRLRLAACHGVKEEALGTVRREGADACLCLEVLRLGRSTLARQTVACPRLSALRLTRGRSAGHACVPLRFERGVLGVMNLALPAGGALRERDLVFLETLGLNVCLAVDRVRSSRAEERRSAEARDAVLRLQRAQDGMMRAERLAAIGTLAASLAHEVRNPLNAINLQLVLLSRRAARLPAPDRHDLDDMVETARREIARLDGLVEEFLSLARVDRLRLATVDLATIAREVIELVAPSAREAGVTITEALEADLPLVRVDREKIEQALLNMVRNAIEAMTSGGRLVLTARRTPDGVALDVQDTGPGIEAGLDVFDFFVTSKPGGTGLGLPIARRIVEAHGGSISYASVPGAGSTFTLALGSECDA